MIRVEGIDRVTRMLNGIQPKKLASNAINTLAFNIKRREEQAIASKLNQPGTLVKKAVRVDKSSPATLTARVYLTPKADELLVQQFMDTGKRRLKIYERLMLSAGVLRSGEFTVPASGAQINPAGNQARKEIVEILTFLKLRKAAATKAKRTRRTTVAPGKLFLADGTRGLKRGIWRQKAPGKVVPVLLFVSQSPRYTKRIPFVEIAKDEVRRNWQRAVQEAFEYQMRQVKA